MTEKITLSGKCYSDKQGRIYGVVPIDVPYKGEKRWYIGKTLSGDHWLITTIDGPYTAKYPLFWPTRDEAQRALDNAAKLKGWGETVPYERYLRAR